LNWLQLSASQRQLQLVIIAIIAVLSVTADLKLKAVLQSLQSSQFFHCLLMYAIFISDEHEQQCSL